MRRIKSGLPNASWLLRKKPVNDHIVTAQLPPTPDYAPFREGPFKLAMGLQPLDLRDWIEPDDRFVAELAEKERLLTERHQEVFVVLPEAAEGSAELLETLVVHVVSRFPTVYQRNGEILHNLLTKQTWNLERTELHPLDLAGRLVQEDFCVMKPDPADGVYRLVGASVCFPTRWRMLEKMGKSLTAIHDPVPGYEEQLASTVDRYFERIKVDKPVWRMNWSIIDDPTLFQPTGHGRKGLNPDITPDNVGEKLWLRMERQTLRRLPRSQDVIFTIRVYVRSFHYFVSRPERAATLAAAIRALPEPMRLYKSLPPFIDAALAWLDRVAAAKWEA